MKDDTNGSASGITEKALTGEWTPDVLDALAEKIVERLEERGAVSVPKASQLASLSLVDAATLAQELSVSVDWVYRHKHKLGVQRLGSGPKARLRFDVEKARAELQKATLPTIVSKPKPRKRQRSKRPPVPLLPIAGNVDTVG